MMNSMQNHIPHLQISNNNHSGQSLNLTPLSSNGNNTSTPILKIIETSNHNNHHHHHNNHSDPQIALQIQDVTPIALSSSATAAQTQALNRKTSIGLSGPVTDL